MRQYLKIYKKLLDLNLATLFVYRGGLISSLISSTVWGSFHLVSILLLTSKASSVYGWTRNELIILTGAFSILWGFFHLFFARNFVKIADIIHFGKLDGFLLKPVDSQFLLSSSIINYTGFFRTFLGVFIVLFIIIKNQITISLINIIGFSVLIAFGLLLIYSTWFIIITLLIWSTRLSNLVDLLFNISGISRYPTEMYQGILRYFFFLLPFMLMVVTPTKILLNRILLGEVIQFIILAFVLFFISRFFWKFALRYYTSASS